MFQIQVICIVLLLSLSVFSVMTSPGRAFYGHQVWDAAPRLRRPQLGEYFIVGGTDADIKDFPYQLSYEYLGWHYCGASIISAKWAATAAHCSFGKDPEDMTLRAGTSIVGQGGRVYDVSRIVIHEEYDVIPEDYDISVVKIFGRFKFGPTIAAIRLAYKTPAAGVILTVSGWGATSEEGSSPSHLQQVQVPVVDHNQCNKIYWYRGGVTDSMLCAGVKKGGKDSCQGDSGGPYIANGRLVGIVSWGKGCASPEYPGVAADVAFLREWVTQKTGI